MAVTESGDAKRIAELEAKIEALMDRLAKTQAEFDNFRLRTEKEKMDIQRYHEMELAKLGKREPST